MPRTAVKSRQAGASRLNYAARAVLVVLVASVAAIGWTQAEAAPGRVVSAPFSVCHRGSGALCATVPAPLDYTGAVAGTVPLTVEVLPTTKPKGTLMLVAGGPGQASAEVFDLAAAGSLWQLVFPGYTLVTYDDRGTGGSAPLVCSSLEGVNADATFNQLVALIGTCGDSLGPTRDYYATRDNAQDMETIRNTLGVDKLAIWGTSYGTQQALAYASAFPTHVERLLLDSTIAPDGRDPFAGAMLRNIPAGLSALCANSLCAAATSDAAGEAVTLANRLAATPLTGAVRRPRARPFTVRLDGLNYLTLVMSIDSNPGIAAALPAATHAALAGHPKALLRLYLLSGADATGGSSESFAYALLFATTCADGPSPWPADTPPGGRKAMLDAAVAALAPGTLGPFGPWAAALGTASACLAWPTPAKRAPLPTGPLPDVPVLVLSGEHDMRTPTADARIAAAQFPHGQLLVVPGSGHSVLSSDFSGCALKGVWNWLADKQVAPCKRSRPYFAPLAGYLNTLASARPAKGVAGNRGRTLTAVGRTLRDAEAAWLTTYTYDQITGLTGGVLDPGASGSFRLRAYSDVPGVALTGTLKLGGFGTGESWTGTITISGSAAAHGVLHVKNRKLTGTLGGKHVTATA